MRWIVAALTACLLFMPAAQAGTAEDPEITDAGDDSGSPSPGMDVDAAWIEPAVAEGGTDAIQFMVHTSGDFQHVAAFFAAHQQFRLGFVVDPMPANVAEYYLALRPSCPTESVVVTSAPDCTAESVSCSLGMAAEKEGFQDLSSEQSIASVFPAGDTMGCVLPIAMMSGYQAGSTVQDFYVLHQLVVRGPLSGGDTIGPEVIDVFDRAPDEGFGRAWAVAPDAPDVVREDVGFPVEVDHVFHETTNATYEFNWTSPGGNLTVSVDAEAEAGNVTFDLLAGNETFYSCTCEGAFEETFTDAPAGNWTVRLVYDSFIGNVTVRIAEAADGTGEEDGDGSDEEETGTETGSTSATDGPDSDGNETLDAGADEEASLPFAAAASAVALGAWIRRRR